MLKIILIAKRLSKGSSLEFAVAPALLSLTSFLSILSTTTKYKTKQGIGINAPTYGLD
jgi:hypothetical protein